MIKPDKIGDVIGPKGKTIRGIQDQTGAKINIEDSGMVTIAAVGGEAGEKARQMVMALVAEPEVGKIYEGPVKSTTAVRRLRRDHARGRRACCTSASCSTPAPRRPRTSSRRATS